MAHWVPVKSLSKAQVVKLRNLEETAWAGAGLKGRSRPKVFRQFGSSLLVDLDEVERLWPGEIKVSPAIVQGAKCEHRR